MVALAGKFALGHPNAADPRPRVMGPFVGWVELICGILVLIGLFSRASLPTLIVIVIVAITSTKVPILLGHEW
ncbi:MAG: DoxX family membrane protein [Sphingomonadaceae bacterium]|nr:DoxX family membrane protein [Sphingomonadaceae bacterium]